MAAGVEERDHVAFANAEPGWWVPMNGSINATVLPKGEFMTHDNVLERAKLDWLVEKVPAWDQLPDGSFESVEREYWIRRTDSPYCKLGRVGERYELYQNHQATEFCDFLLDGGYLYDTAGSLFNNKTVFLLMKMGEDIVIGGDERETIESWLVFMNTHDGSGSITLAIVKIRVVCANTLAWALAGATRMFKVRHTESLDDKMQDARKALDMTFKYDKRFEEEVARMIDRRMTEGDIEKVLDSMLPLVDAKGDPKKGRALTSATSTRDAIVGLYHHADNLKHLPNCQYKFVQAAEEYSDHLAIFRNTDTAKAEDNRFKKMVDGKTLGSQAYTLLAAS